VTAGSAHGRIAAMSLDPLSHAVNPALNAIARDRVHEAQKEPALADRKLADVGPNAVGPFHGMPLGWSQAVSAALELEFVFGGWVPPTGLA
jgi:hypothetical protein